MQPLTIITGTAAVLPLANIDTDVIIRIERLTQGDQTTLGKYAFEALRYRADGTENPDFPLNRAGWRAAPILLVGPNFGCGSSREGAVVALAQNGIRVIVAHSFGDIFYSNCFQNGMLPIRLPEPEVLRLMALSEEGGAPFTVDLIRQVVIDSAGEDHPFDIDPLRREGLLAGLDDVGLSLRDGDLITAWQASDRSRRPWIWNPVHRDAPGRARSGEPA
jgi:3-isopropylmalate/(R)-2-methylmalate dehydratase small subunit